MTKTTIIIVFVIWVSVAMLFGPPVGRWLGGRIRPK
jgi:hypothetical protein